MYNSPGVSTPKRALKYSPDTPLGLEGKMERFSLEQTASPTIRKGVHAGEMGRERKSEKMPTAGDNDEGLNRRNLDLLRRMAFGKRRILSNREGEEVVDPGNGSKVSDDQNIMDVKSKSKSKSKRCPNKVVGKKKVSNGGEKKKKKKSVNLDETKGQRKIKDIFAMSQASSSLMPEEREVDVIENLDIKVKQEENRAPDGEQMMDEVLHQI